MIDHLRAEGIEPHFVVRADDNNVVQGFVTAGFGAALIPRLTAELMSGSFDVRPFEPPLPPRVIALAWKDDLDIAMPVRAFVDATTRVVREIWRDRAIDTFHELPSVAGAHL